MSRVVPSGTPGGSPRGRPARIKPNDAAATRRALTRQNEAAEILARAGYEVEQNPPPLPNGKEPAYKIEGEYFDCYDPSTPNARNIVSSIQGEKLMKGQAGRIGLNLDDSSVSSRDLHWQLTNYPVPGLQEIIIMKGGTVIAFFPFSP